MEEVRTKFNRGLRLQFKNFRAAVCNKDKSDMLFEKNIILGYLSSGYWTEIISGSEYNKLWRVTKKIYNDALKEI